jgi:branched-chain amino acid transport system ATP-binding protein
MLDEPSQGLAPLLVREVFGTIIKMKDQIGLTVLLIEQNADASLNAADYVYIMHEGMIKAEGEPEEIKGSPEIREAYLGI